MGWHCIARLVAVGLAGSMAGGAQAAAPAPGPASAPAVTPAGTDKVVLVVGDSLSAEYGLATGTGWVNLLGQRMAQQHYRYRAVNASISGDTTSGGRSRLPALLKQWHPAIVILELGGNDALRGTPLATSRANLDAMAAASTAAGAKVVVAGIQVPPNYGRQYTQDFAAMFADTARTAHAPLVPFVLKGIADRPDADDWFQADRIHPVAKAHPIILENIWPAVQPLLRK